MRQLIPYAALALSIGALAVAFIDDSEPRRAAEAPAPPEPAYGGADVEELEERIRYLETANEQLARRLTQLERRPSALPLDGGTALPEAVVAEVADLRNEVRSMIAGEALHSEGGKQYLREAVREVQQELEAERRQAWMQRAQQREAEAATERTERWRKFVTDAQLSYTQEQELTRRIAAEDERRKALMDELRAGTRDPRSMRQELRALRQETDAAMRQTLSDEQYAKYQETRREERPRGGGGGGFGGRDRNGDAAGEAAPR